MKRTLSLLLSVLLALPFPLMRRAFAAGEEGGNTGSPKEGSNDGAKKGQTATQKSFHSNLSTGSSSFSVPIEVPPGVAGMEPKIALVYSSEAPVSSIVGHGWSLELGKIYRRGPNRGTPTYTNADTFVIQVNGLNSDLYPRSVSPTEPEFTTTDETFSKITFDRSNNRWTYKTPDGMEYRFGYGTNYTGAAVPTAKWTTVCKAGLTHPCTEPNTHTWLLQQVRNFDGYAIDYFYDIDEVGGDYYPWWIKYTRKYNAETLTSNDDVNATRRVLFSRLDKFNGADTRCLSWNEATDTWDPVNSTQCSSVTESYDTGSKVALDGRISMITTYTNRSPSPNVNLRKYSLEYQNNDIWAGKPDWSTPEMSLIAVREYGSNDTLLSRSGFEYTTREAGWQKQQTTPELPTVFVAERPLGDPAHCDPQNPNNQTGCKDGPYYTGVGANLSLIDADGNLDLAISKKSCESAGSCSSPTGTPSAYRNNGTTGWTESATPPPLHFLTTPYLPDPDASDVPQGQSFADEGVVPIDINGDNRTDYVKAVVGYSTTVPLNDGTSFASNCPTSMTTRQVWINNGSGWSRDTPWELSLNSVAWAYQVGNVCEGSPSHIKEQQSYGAEFVDLNQDRCPDLMIYNQSTRSAVLNPCPKSGVTPGSWALAPVGLRTVPFRTDFADAQSGDFNGDDLADQLKAFRPVGGTITVDVALNTGAGWVLPATSNAALRLKSGIVDVGFALATADTKNAMPYDMALADVNNDHRVDLVSNCWVKGNHANGGFFELCPNFSNGDPIYDPNGDGVPDDASKICYDSSNQPIRNFVACTAENLTRYVLSGVQGSIGQVVGNYGYGSRLLKAKDAPGTGYVVSARYCDTESVNPVGPSCQGSMGATGTRVEEKAAYEVTGSAPALLSVVHLPTGGTVTFTYDMVGGSAQMAFSKAVVSDVTVDEGGTRAGKNVVHTHYSYFDGKYDVEKAEFRGFGRAEVREDTGNRSVTWFHQDIDVIKGQVDATESYGSDNKRYSRSEYFYTSDLLRPPTLALLDQTGPPYFNPVRAVRSYSYPTGSTSYVMSESETLFSPASPDINNPITQQTSVAKGDPNYTPTSEWKISRTDFVANTANGLLTLPSRQRVCAYSANLNCGTAYVDTCFIYDGLASTCGQAPESNRVKQTNVTTNFNGYTNTASTRVVYNTTTKFPTDTYDTLNRHTTIAYNADPEGDHAAGLYPTTVTNPLGQVATTNYNVQGAVEKVTDPNGIVSETRYDTFQRPIRSLVYPVAGTNCALTSSTCNETKIEYLGLCDTACVPVNTTDDFYVTLTDPRNQRVRTSTRQNATQGEANWPWAESYVDGFGRGWLSKSKSLNAAGTAVTEVNSETLFDQYGRPYKSSLPYYTGQRPSESSNLWAMTTYDAIGRVKYIEAPANDGQKARVETIYDIDPILHGPRVTTIDPRGKSKQAMSNAFGQLVRVIEFEKTISASTPVAHAVDYQYDALGNMNHIWDQPTSADANIPAIVIDTTYNGLGQKRTMDDPDMGVWTYEYFDDGALKKQTDAKGNVVELIYDGLGRLQTKTEKIPGGTLYSTSTFTYDKIGATPQGKSLGKIVQEQKNDMISGVSTVVYRANYFYDNLGRLSWKQTEIFPGTTTADSGHLPVKYTYSYNDANAPLTTEYDSLKAAGHAGKEMVTYNYDTLNVGVMQGMQTNYGGTLVSNVKYDEAGRLVQMITNPGANSYTASYSYNTTGDQRLASLKIGRTSVGGSPVPNSLIDRSYLYDLSGNILGINDFRYGVLNTTENCNYDYSTQKTYGYDEVERLTMAQELQYKTRKVSAGCVAQTLSSSEARYYAFDRMGNIIQMVGQPSIADYKPFGQSYYVPPATSEPPSDPGFIKKKR